MSPSHHTLVILDCLLHPLILRFESILRHDSILAKTFCQVPSKWLLPKWLGIRIHISPLFRLFLHSSSILYTYTIYTSTALHTSSSRRQSLPTTTRRIVRIESWRSVLDLGDNTNFDDRKERQDNPIRDPLSTNKPPNHQAQ